LAEFLAKGGAAAKTRRNVIADLGTVWEGLRRVRDDVKENPWTLVLPAAESVPLWGTFGAKGRLRDPGRLL
jgi:hypothetical protein